MIKLNHIGIAVKDLSSMKRLFSILGLEVNFEETVAEQGVKAHFLPLPFEEGHLEFLEVTNPKGTVAKFIEKRGPGIHHLAFIVPTGHLDGLCKKLLTEGFKLTFEKPKKGAKEMRINFIHPASAGGILIELMENEH